MFTVIHFKPQNGFTEKHYYYKFFKMILEKYIYICFVFPLYKH